MYKIQDFRRNKPEYAPLRAPCYIQKTYFCGNFKLLNNSELKEHANAGFDEVKLGDGEVAEGEQVQALSVDIVSWRAGSFLNKKTRDSHESFNAREEQTTA